MHDAISIFSTKTQTHNKSFTVALIRTFVGWLVRLFAQSQSFMWIYIYFGQRTVSTKTKTKKKIKPVLWSCSGIRDNGGGDDDDDGGGGVSINATIFGYYLGMQLNSW